MLVILNINSRKIVREAKELKKEPEKILDEYLSRNNDQEYSVGDEDLTKFEKKVSEIKNNNIRNSLSQLLKVIKDD